MGDLQWVDLSVALASVMSMAIAASCALALFMNLLFGKSPE